MAEKVTFVKIPKNASSSIVHKIKEVNAITRYKTTKPIDKENIFSWASQFHPLLSESVSDCGEEILNYPCFAVCRNPYDRFLSMFKFFKMKWGILESLEGITSDITNFATISYLEYKQEGHNKMGNFIASQSEFLDVDVDIEILRFENLQNEFSDFVKKHNLPIDPKLDEKNSSSPMNKYQIKHTDQSKEIVQTIWRDDFERFGYEL